MAWICGVAVIVALAVGTTSVVLGRTAGPTLVAAKSQAVSAGGAFSDGDANDPAPQRMIPRPSPDPSPTPPPPPVAPPAAAPAAPPAPPARPAPPPPPAIVIGSTQQALINQDRAANGLGPLTWNGCLLNVARSNASRMAAQGAISHANGPQTDLACGLGHQAGENVGYWSAGVNDGQLNTMFMNSAGHRANILGPYRYVATAWVVAPNGYGYIAVEFS
ncbi:MAG TPA: CAP domain-containing protein [Candidatus Dormibacteraeota bacterium]|nr:CAP domain-containing protein [Candidatus Dormibacteraeota bacterium]